MDSLSADGVKHKPFSVKNFISVEIVSNDANTQMEFKPSPSFKRTFLRSTSQRALESTAIDSGSRQESRREMTVDDIAVEELLQREKSHLRQWKKHLMALSIIVMSIVVNFLRGSKKSPSVIGIKKCGVLDWTIFGIYVLITIFMFLLGVYINKTE